MSAMVDQAKSLAIQAHSGQVDKAGQPYLGHPERVAARVREMAPGDADAECVAWLHDVVEDTEVSLEQIRAAFGSTIAGAVDAITKRPAEDRDTYYRRVAGNDLALTVKHADLADNTDPERLDALDPVTRARLTGKYAHARAVLAGSSRPAETGV